MEELLRRSCGGVAEELFGSCGGAVQDAVEDLLRSGGASVEELLREDCSGREVDLEGHSSTIDLCNGRRTPAALHRCCVAAAWRGQPCLMGGARPDRAIGPVE